MCLLLASSCIGARSADGSSGNDEGQKRADITQQQRDLKTRFDSEERECRQQFIVTACVDSVRSRRRAALAPLRDEELRLDEIQRRLQAEKRRAAIADKQRALAERGAEPAPVAPAASRESAKAPRGAWRAPEPKPDRDAEATAAADRVQASARRQAQAAEAQARVTRRQAEQAKKGKAAAPLPDPSASGAARR